MAVKKLPFRDRQVTCQRLISAVGSLLAKKGFTGLGINAVAREAGVDKVLIYRYFDGLPGLIAAFARQEDFWPPILELAGNDLASFSQLPVKDRLSRFAANFIRALKKRPLTQAIMAWEMVEPNELTKELERVREESILTFFQMFFVKDSSDIDLQALIMLVGAALSYLVIRSNSLDVYGGLDLTTDQGWQRIESVVNLIVQQVVTPE
ncbi:MAG TPA: TetR/AcrR family transcriptional regulator [Desulfotignum sp.]|jgi:AcrR family transcriptional regulator|nr:TetR/AcrR family transcriptional regulator [Desulfotignum sp.]